MLGGMNKKIKGKNQNLKKNYGGGRGGGGLRKVARISNFFYF